MESKCSTILLKLENLEMEFLIYLFKWTVSDLFNGLGLNQWIDVAYGIEKLCFSLL
jgi:hypothetical protein